MRQDTLTLIVGTAHLGAMLNSITNAANSWVGSAPAVGLIEKVNDAGNAKALAMKIALDTSIAGGIWQTYLTRNRDMSVIITQNKDCMMNILFIGSGVQVYRSTFFETVIQKTRPLLLNAGDYPEPQVVV